MGASDRLETPLATDMVYDVVELENPGLNELVLGDSPLRSAFVDFARVTATVYVFVVEVSWAVTTTVSVVTPPSVSGSDADATPEVTVTLFTFTVAEP